MELTKSQTHYNVSHKNVRLKDPNGPFYRAGTKTFIVEYTIYVYVLHTGIMFVLFYLFMYSVI